MREGFACHGCALLGCAVATYSDAILAPLQRASRSPRSSRATWRRHSRSSHGPLLPPLHREHRRSRRSRRSRHSSSSRAWTGRSRPSCSKCCRQRTRRRTLTARPQRRLPLVSCLVESVGQVRVTSHRGAPSRLCHYPAHSRRQTVPSLARRRTCEHWGAWPLPGEGASRGASGHPCAHCPAACHSVHTAELTHPRAAQALGQLVDSLSPEEVAALRDRLDHVERRTARSTVRAAHAAPR